MEVAPRYSNCLHYLHCLNCLNSSMYAYKIRTLLDLGFIGFRANCWSGWTGWLVIPVRLLWLQESFLFKHLDSDMTFVKKFTWPNFQAEKCLLTKNA